MHRNDTNSRRFVHDLDLATWHDHLAARSPQRNDFALRATTRPERARSALLGRPRPIALTMRRWLAHLSGTDRRAA